MLFLLFSILTLPLSQCATIVVDGVSEWKNPQVFIGDSVIFQHKYNYSLYIFKNQNAFSLCNFNQATVLTNPNSISYTSGSFVQRFIRTQEFDTIFETRWHTSRLGIFYFSFNNGSNKACLDGQNLAVKVILPPPQNDATAPELPPVAAPLPSTGGIVAYSPAFPWPFQPRESLSPSPAPGLAGMAGGSDRKGMPFINSNPAVPLPTGEIDSATIRPLPTSGYQEYKQVVRFSAIKGALCSVLFMVFMI